MDRRTDRQTDRQTEGKSKYWGQASVLSKTWQFVQLICILISFNNMFLSVLWTVGSGYAKGTQIWIVTYVILEHYLIYSCRWWLLKPCLYFSLHTSILMTKKCSLWDTFVCIFNFFVIAWLLMLSWTCWWSTTWAYICSSHWELLIYNYVNISTQEISFSKLQNFWPWLPLR